MYGWVPVNLSQSVAHFATGWTCHEEFQNPVAWWVHWICNIKLNVFWPQLVRGRGAKQVVEELFIIVIKQGNMTLVLFCLAIVGFWSAMWRVVSLSLSLWCQWWFSMREVLFFVLTGCLCCLFFKGWTLLLTFTLVSSMSHRACKSFCCFCAVIYLVWVWSSLFFFLSWWFLLFWSHCFI